MPINMKNKLLYISILAIFSAGLCYVWWYKNESSTRVNADESKIAKLTTDGTELKILTNEYSSQYKMNFVFLDIKL